MDNSPHRNSIRPGRTQQKTEAAAHSYLNALAQAEELVPAEADQLARMLKVSACAMLLDGQTPPGARTDAMGYLARWHGMAKAVSPDGQEGSGMSSDAAIQMLDGGAGA